MTRRRFASLSLTAVLLAGCQTLSVGQPAVVANPEAAASGVVIAQTSIVGRAGAVSTKNEPSDCTGAGFGISVHTATDDDNYLFDAAGRPCQAANIIFDGKTPLDSRAADPGINIKMLDKFGPQISADAAAQAATPLVLSTPANDAAAPEQLAGIPVPDVAEQVSETADIMPGEIAAVADAQRHKGQQFGRKLTDTIKDWKDTSNRDRLLKETESLMADARTVKRIANLTQLREQQEKMAELTALLREAERQAQEQQQKNQQMQQTVEKNRALLDSTRVGSSIENEKLRQQVEQLQARIKDFDRYNQGLKSQYEQRQAALQKKIADLSADLKVSEARAQASRQAAVLQAAQQIADAQRLAYAAQVSQRQAMEMESKRLQMEASTLASKATKLPSKIPEKTGPAGVDKAYAAMLSGALDEADVQRLAQIVINGKATAEDLENVNITIQQENVPLKDIFAVVMADLEPTQGSWRISWQLRPDHAKIPDEKWTVAAESTFNDFVSLIVVTDDEGEKPKSNDGA